MDFHSNTTEKHYSYHEMREFHCWHAYHWNLHLAFNVIIHANKNQ